MRAEMHKPFVKTSSRPAPHGHEGQCLHDKSASNGANALQHTVTDIPSLRDIHNPPTSISSPSINPPIPTTSPVPNPHPSSLTHQAHQPSPTTHHSVLHIRRLPHRLHHLLNQHQPRLLPALAQPQTHVTQQRWVADERTVAVAHDVGRPLELRRVGVAGADVARLEGFELLLLAEFVGHDFSGRGFVRWEEGCGGGGLLLKGFWRWEGVVVEVELRAES